jgi:ABC-2 type transport system permease protein
MPRWLHTAVDANPVSDLVTAVREILDGHPEPTRIGWLILVAAALTQVLAPLSLRLYRRR